MCPSNVKCFADKRSCAGRHNSPRKDTQLVEETFYRRKRGNLLKQTRKSCVELRREVCCHHTCHSLTCCAALFPSHVMLRVLDDRLFTSIRHNGVLGGCTSARTARCRFGQSNKDFPLCTKFRTAIRVSPLAGDSSGEASAMNRPLPPFDSVQAVLFDVDGTLADSDPLHFIAFRDMLVEIGYNGGMPITEEFFSLYISGRHNPEIGAFLMPGWDEERREKWLDDKEALFRRLAAQHLKPVTGLHRLADWVRERGLRRAAVTNAPRLNAEQLIAAVGLTDFFEYLVIGSECKRAKPFPDPYLKALEHFGVSPENAFAIEDSTSGLKAAVAAGVPVVGVTTGNPGPPLLAAGAAFLVRDYNDTALWQVLAPKQALPSVD